MDVSAIEVSATDLCVASDAGTTLKIPYETTDDRGWFLELKIDSRNLAGSFIPAEQPPLVDLMGDVVKAVENPIGGRKLSELLAGARKVAIITENQFRAAPTTQIVPWLLAQIRKAGATPVILIGCGKMAVLAPEAIETEIRARGRRKRGRDLLQRRQTARELRLQRDHQLRGCGLGAPQSCRGRRHHQNFHDPGDAVGLRRVGNDHSRRRRK